MKRRALSLFLTMVMIASLFTGLGASASAATTDEIGQLFDRYLTGDKFTDLFSGSPVRTGACEKVDGYGLVWYQIYRVDPARLQELMADSSILEQNEYFQKLRERFPDLKVDGQSLLQDLSFDNIQLDTDKDYYAVKLYTTGSSAARMPDFTLTSPAPWNGHITVDGEDVDLTESLIAAYVDQNIQNISQRAFFGMDGLMLVYLGANVKEIGARAFETCDTLSAINFPASLESIGRRAFYACDYLTFVRMKACTKLTRIEDRAFCTCSRLTMMAFPENITSIGQFAFAWDHVLGTEQFSLPSKLRTIEQGAFAFCAHLGATNELVIPASVTSIGDWAFACAFNMSELQINPGDSALRIGMGAFAGSGDVKTILFPNRVTDIGDYAFAACDRLEDVAFGDKTATDSLHLRAIGNRAFDGLEDTGLSALRRVADAFRVTESGDSEYVDGSRTAAEAVSAQAYDLSGVTPLKRAAFGSVPPSSAVQPATAVMHSFPTTVTVYYPSQDYNASAYSKWRSELSYDGSLVLWRGYLCEPTWEGHFHLYNGEPTIVERTCTQDGMEVYTCMYWDGDHFCGHVEERITEKATGHHSEILEERDATCTQPGERVFHCDNEWCDTPYYTETIPAKGHDLEHLIGTNAYKAPTCTEDGYARGRCPDCGAQVNEILPALGHDVSNLRCIQEPDCTHEGEYYGYCPRCNRSSVRQIVPALGHSWDEGRVTRQATATEDGVILYTCLRCGDTKTEIIPKTVHTHQYEKSVVAPSCTTEGYTRYCCTICGFEYHDDFVPAAHKWDSGEVVKAPTATEKGVMLYTCTVCGAYQTEDIAPTGQSGAFVDVPEGIWFYEPVNWAVQNGITNGVAPGYFVPDGTCTRAQAVTFLYRAAGSPTVYGTSGFSDVQRGDWYYDAVIWAVREGITNGIGGGLFNPNGTCTRAHIVTFLHRSHHSPEPQGAYVPFWDVDPASWYAKPVIWAAENHITEGVGGGAFAPGADCTRAQIVTFIHRDYLRSHSA